MPLQVSCLVMNVAESGRPVPGEEFVDTLSGTVPALFVDLGGGELEEAGRFELADASDFFPVIDSFRPAVLPLANPGEHGVALGFVWKHLDDIGVSALCFAKTLNRLESVTEVPEERNVPPGKLNLSDELPQCTGGIAE